jgi:hypothetical protein
MGADLSKGNHDLDREARKGGAAAELIDPNSEIGTSNLPQSFGGEGFRRDSTYCSNMPRFSSSLFRSKSCNISGLRISEFGFEEPWLGSKIK